MQYAKLLIDKASSMCGSDKALAERMGIYPSDISHLRAGKRPLSPELAAELADIAGDDARDAAISAIIIRNENSRKGAVLREILGKGVAAGVAGLLLLSYSGESISATDKIATKADAAYHAIHRIYSMKRRAAARTLARIIKAWFALRRSAPRPPGRTTPALGILHAIP